jgi:hypothetical protein
VAVLIMLVRHAEKPVGDAPPYGVTVDGTVDPESLTPRGWQRAGAMVGLFVGDAASGRSALLPTPTHLFASQVGSGSSSARPSETLTPLAARLGLTVDERFRKEELDTLNQAVQEIGGIVLVAWEHHLIPALAATLVNDATRVPKVWPDDRYDLVWVFEDFGPKGPELRQVPQMLLSGDRPNVIA